MRNINDMDIEVKRQRDSYLLRWLVIDFWFEEYSLGLI